MRLKRTGTKVTFSISVSAETKKKLRRAARRYGGNVSALIETMLEELERREALEWILRRSPPVDPVAYKEFLAELEGRPTRRRKKAA